MWPTSHSPLKVVRAVLVDTGAEPGWAELEGHQFIAPAYLTARLINEGMQDLMETASRSEHAQRMVGGTIAFRDRRVPTHVAHWGRDPPNSIGRCAL
jgi:hypothetical protein